MVSPRAIWQQAAHKPTNCLLAAQQGLYKKPAEKRFENFLEKIRMDHYCISRKKMTRQNKRTRQKNKRGDRKGESNDNPEIPDRRVISHIPGLPSGLTSKELACVHHCTLCLSGLAGQEQLKADGTVCKLAHFEHDEYAANKGNNTRCDCL